MKKYTFEDIENQGLLLYRYYRGSHTYGTAVPTSDWDEGGVYIEPIEQVLGLGYDFQDEISDEKHDKVWYGLKKYMNLLCTSNPNILESLFVDDEFVIYEHPIITELKKHRQEFVTKACFKPFLGYAYQQIVRCHGLNRLCVQPIEVRKMPIDFCYTTYKQGTSNMTDWLTARGLKQQYCGLVSLNNMPDCYGVYYDFGAHNHNEYDGDYEKFVNDELYFNYVKNNTLCAFATSIMPEWFENTQTPIGYRGIVKGDGTADDVRCSSIPKDVMPICTMSYNKDGFTQHCNKYKQYQDWVKKRNPQRYLENKEKTFDRKNVAHVVRLLHMGLEIATTGEVHVNRKGIDADFILNIRQGNTEYEEIISYIEGKKDEMEKAMKVSTLPEAIDRDRVNQLLIDVRYKYQINK